MNVFKIITFFLCLVSLNINANIITNNGHNPKYSLRRHSHVKTLYERLGEKTINLCIENKVPPAAILAILSLESGWGRGYVGNISGNFLSLNATRNEHELPALYLPYVIKTKKILYLNKDINKYKPKELKWVHRPASLKKDYRPDSIAGTKNNLEYFKQYPEKLTKANIKNITDFVHRFISLTSRISAYREARTLLNTEIEKHGIEILFDKELNQKFVNTIGGKPNSYNYRKSWPIKVLKIMNRVGAIELTRDMYINKKRFDETW